MPSSQHDDQTPSISGVEEKDQQDQLDAWVAKLLNPGLIGAAGSEQDRVDPVPTDKADSAAP